MYMAWQCILLGSFILVIIYHFSWNYPFLFGNLNSKKSNIWHSIFDDLTLRLEKLAAVPKRHFCTGLPWQADISVDLRLPSTTPNLLLLVPMFSPSDIYSYNLVDTLKKWKIRNTAHFVKDRPDWAKLTCIFIINSAAKSSPQWSQDFWFLNFFHSWIHHGLRIIITAKSTIIFFHFRSIFTKSRQRYTFCFFLCFVLIWFFFDFGKRRWFHIN